MTTQRGYLPRATSLPVEIVRDPAVLVAAGQPLDDLHARKQQRGGRENEEPEPAGEAGRAKERVGPRHIDDKHADEDGDDDACEGEDEWREKSESMWISQKSQIKTKTSEGTR